MGKREISSASPVTRGFAYIAIWQCAAFLILILLVWANEIYDFAALLFDVLPSPPNLTRGFLASAGILIGLIIAVGNTYLQQQRIISGMLTICSYCHNIRIDREIWQRVEEYIAKHGEVDFTHGICPDCFEKVMGDVAQSAHDEEHS